MIEWRTRYLKTDSPDEMNRWARIGYYKGLLIFWICRVEVKDRIGFSISPYFPSNGSDCPLNHHLKYSIKEAKEWAENEFRLFLNKLEKP
jgi:hypothetical protein